jgi:hypothetical protein
VGEEVCSRPHLSTHCSHFASEESRKFPTSTLPRESYVTRVSNGNHRGRSTRLLQSPSYWEGLDCLRMNVKQQDLSVLRDNRVLYFHLSIKKTTLVSRYEYTGVFEEGPLLVPLSMPPCCGVTRLNSSRFEPVLRV